MQSILQNKWQYRWVMICLAMVIAGLVFSRAMLSIASVAIALPWFFSSKRERLSVGKPFTALLLLMIPVLASVFWSANKAEWWNAVSVRIPLFTILLGLYAVRLSRREWMMMGFVYLAVIGTGCVWSLYMYIANTAAIEAAYLRAKVLPTLADHDYVRFSWMVAVAVLLAAKMAILSVSKQLRLVCYVLMAFFVGYLHVLAAKTGLLCIYGAAAVWLFSLVIRRKWKVLLVGTTVLVLMAFLAMLTMPTLRNRMQYVRYDFSLYSKNGSAPGYNDAARWLSIKAGYQLMQQNPVVGVGFGDLREAVNNWHNTYHPQSLVYERFLPANAWMIYGAASGWTGLLLFSIGFVLLLVYTLQGNWWSRMLGVVTVIPVVFDDTLEGQLGIAILAFISFFAQSVPAQPENHEPIALGSNHL